MSLKNPNKIIWATFWASLDRGTWAQHQVAVRESLQKAGGERARWGRPVRGNISSL
jgi:hypothetical protein